MSAWLSALELDHHRKRIAGGADVLRNAIRGGADMRVGTAFRHNEHLDVNSSNNELVREVMDFRVTYLINDHWVAGIQNLRMPISVPDGFGPRASMSFFLYNEDGHQAIARPHLDGMPAAGEQGPSPISRHANMAKYHESASWDANTNAPSSNFVYDFEYFRYFIRESWEEVLSHDAEGRVESGSIDSLVKSFCEGAELKVAIEGLCDDLYSEGDAPIKHEVFVHLGGCYFCTKASTFLAAANPVVRTRPTVPLGYGSRTWDFGWLMPRTDGYLARWLCDPYTLEFKKSMTHHAMRWFVSR